VSQWRARRFWQDAAPVPGDRGFQIELDGRPVRTPAKATLALPTRALAEAVAAEWRDQGEVIDPGAMPLTRIANTAVDKVAVQRAEVADLVAAYGESDLVCYRADGPPGLVARQAAGWDPLVAWAAEALGAPLQVGTGVMFLPQPEASVAALRARVHALGAWQLAPFHDLVALSGSLVIGFAAIETDRSRRELWDLSRIDETWQAEQWGADEEAAAVAATRARAFVDAARFHDLSVTR